MNEKHMTILYTVHEGGVFVNLRNLKEEEIHEGIKVYVNITNRCPCRCTFCLRQTKQMMESNSLWLKHEPSYQEIIDEISLYDVSDFKEVIFCGFGEPTIRIDTIIEVIDYLHSLKPELPIRINTVGLGNTYHSKDITPLLKNRVDTISISLNAPTKEEFYELTRSDFGIDSYDMMLDFALKCKDYVPHVVLTVVDIIGEEKIAKCQAICDELGLTLRVREYEE